MRAPRRLPLLVLLLASWSCVAESPPGPSIAVSQYTLNVRVDSARHVACYHFTNSYQALSCVRLDTPASEKTDGR